MRSCCNARRARGASGVYGRALTRSAGAAGLARRGWATARRQGYRVCLPRLEIPLRGPPGRAAGALRRRRRVRRIPLARCACYVLCAITPVNLHATLPLPPDALVSSQHETETLPQDWWSTAFATAIRDIGHTVLVLQPWHAPVPLTRSWCLWEIFSTLDAKARLEVLMPPAQAEELHAALDMQFDAISAALSQIDTRRAEAEKPADKVMIDAAVAASEGGFYAVNSRILESLREWLLHETLEVAAARIAQHGAASSDALTARANLARLLGLLGHTAEAATLCGELAAAATAALGARSTQALAARSAHADALAANGELQAALTLLRAVMHDQMQQHAWQPEHPDVLASQVAYSRALVAYSACAARGIMFVRTPAANVGCALLFRVALAVVRAGRRVYLVPHEVPPRLYKRYKLPPHLWIPFWLLTLVYCVLTPFVILLNVADNVIVIWRSWGYLAEAVALCRAAHAELARSGPTLEAFTCAALLGRALRDAGSLDEAEPLLCDAAQGLVGLLGEMHMQTLAVHADLADLLRERGEPGDLVVAESIFRVQAPRLEEQLGAGHPDALCARINVAICVAWQGDTDAAKTMLEATKELVRGVGEDALGWDLYSPARLQYNATNALQDPYCVGRSSRWRPLSPDDITVRFRYTMMSHLRVRARLGIMVGYTLGWVVAAAIGAGLLLVFVKTGLLDMIARAAMGLTASPPPPPANATLGHRRMLMTQHRYASS